MGTAADLIQNKVVAVPQSAPHIDAMRTLVLASLLLVGGSTAALAYCPSVPDDTQSGYTANQTALAVCRQQEMADRLRLEQKHMELQGQINHLELQLRLNAQLSRAQQALSLTQF